MLPIRFLPPCLTSRLTGLALIILLTGAVGPARADRLDIKGVETFRGILKQAPNISSDDESPMVAQKLANYLKQLRDGGGSGPASLSEVAQILLLPDWGTSELSDVDTKVSLTQVEEAVVRKQDSDAFKREVQGLLAMADDKPRVGQMILDEIKRVVRLALLDRLVDGIRPYLRDSRREVRMAAANLITQTMTDARKQGNPGGMKSGERRGRRLRRVPNFYGSDCWY